MDDIIKGIEFLGIPATIAIIVVGLIFILQIIGEIAELMGKVVPEALKIRKYFKRKKEEREKTAKTLQQVETLLKDVNGHYSKDNIANRDAWIKSVDDNMTWVHERAQEYDNSIILINESLTEVKNALKANTKMTEDMFVESSRDRIINFAEKASDYNYVLSREQFRRIDRVYNEYEKFLKERGRQNGEVDTAYELIQDGYKYRLKHHSFVEDIRAQQLTV